MNFKSTRTKTNSIIVCFVNIFCAILLISMSSYLTAGVCLLSSIIMFSYHLELRNEKPLNKYHKSARKILIYLVIILVIVDLIYLGSLLV